MRKITLFALLVAPFIGFSQHNITFQVDMNNFSGSFNTPEVNGEFNNWCGNCAAMSDANSDGIWNITIPVTADSVEYKFSYDNWGGQEVLTPGMPCTKTTGQFTNRFLVITGDTTLPAFCWESCATCSGTPANSDVTFQVDLSDYTGSFSTVNLNGTFNNWCGYCAVMTDANNDSIYELTVNVPNDTVEYKFTLDGWATQETLIQGQPCTKTTIDAGGTFTNRFIVPAADTTLPAVCWGSCATCASIGLDENWLTQLRITPNPNNGVFYISGNVVASGKVETTVTDLQGRVIFQATESVNGTINQTIDLEGVENGMYMVTITSDYNSITEKVVIRHY